MISTRKVLIFVVAYEAETTLAGVLARIPPLPDHIRAEVLVIDDSSRDGTFEVGLRARASTTIPVTVLYNPANQGYGGNQKLGYTYAIRHGFDAVILLHGDGQYAPECIPDLLRPILDEDADAVFGSRMMTTGGARRGGMPLYKFAGNRILSWCQNRLLHTTLSEFHSGFRAYRVRTLAQIPFQYNSNGFHFDTEIIIQLIRGGYRIVERPIPTYYGDEICRVNGLGYAWNVMRTTVLSRLHGVNLLYDRKFNVDRADNRHYSLKLGYRSSHTAAIDAVPPRARVIDIGCGPGQVAEQLVAKGCVVTGVDQFPPANATAFDEFHIWQEPAPLDIDLRPYDCVLLLDIIEHLREPEHVLDRLRDASKSRGDRPTFIVTTGNVTFFVVRLQALFGRFNYGKRGILDLSHTRLYTFKTLRHLFEQCGFRIARVEGIPAPFPLALGDGWLARAALRLNEMLIAIAPGLFAYQIFMVAVPTPTVDALLDTSVSASAVRSAARDVTPG